MLSAEPRQLHRRRQVRNKVVQPRSAQHTPTARPCPLDLQVHDGFFVDLFVRKSNDVAVDMYTKLGYVKYREVRRAVLHSPQLPVRLPVPASLIC